MSAAAVLAATAVATLKPARRKLFTLVLLAEPKPNFVAAAAAVAPAHSSPLAPLSASAAAASLASSPYTRLLLGLKKRGFGQGKWNGFGGKLDEGETPRQAAIREMKEESDVESVRTREMPHALCQSRCGSLTRLCLSSLFCDVRVRCMLSAWIPLVCRSAP